MSKIVHSIKLLAVYLALSPLAANALPVTVNFTGSIAGIDAPLNGEAPFSVGDTATAWLTYDPAAPKTSSCCFDNAVIDFGIDLGSGAVWNYDPSITSRTLAQARYAPSEAWFSIWNYDYSGTSGSVTAPEYNAPANGSSWTSGFVPWQTVFFFRVPDDLSVLPQQPEFTYLRTDYVINGLNSNGRPTSFQQGVRITWNQISFDTGPGQVPSPATFSLLGLGLVGLGWSRRRQAPRA